MLEAKENGGGGGDCSDSVGTVYVTQLSCTLDLEGTIRL